MEKYERIHEDDLLKDFEKVKLIFVKGETPRPKLMEYSVELPKDMKSKIHSQLIDQYGISASINIEAATIKVYLV